MLIEYSIVQLFNVKHYFVFVLLYSGNKKLPSSEKTVPISILVHILWYFLWYVKLKNVQIHLCFLMPLLQKLCMGIALACVNTLCPSNQHRPIKKEQTQHIFILFLKICRFGHNFFVSDITFINFTYMHTHKKILLEIIYQQKWTVIFVLFCYGNVRLHFAEKNMQTSISVHILWYFKGKIWSILWIYMFMCTVL